MNASIHSIRPLIAGSIAAAAFLASGCASSRTPFLLSKETPASHRSGVSDVDSARAQEVTGADASRFAENSSLTQPPTPEIRLVGASDFDTSSSFESLQAIDGAAQVETISSWSLAAIESIALQQNPALLQASASANKAMGYRNQVGRKPNPIVGYQGAQIADKGTDQHAAFYEQEIVRGDKLRRNERVLNQEIQSQLWEVETQRFRVLTDVRQRFYEALAAQRRMKLANEFEVVAVKGVRVAEARMNAKEGTRPEILQAEIQLKQVQLQHRQAAAAYRGAWKQLMATAGMPDAEQGSLDGELADFAQARDWDAITAQILASSPELQGARARLSRARANVDRQQAQAIPNLTLMLAAGQDNGTNSGFMNTQVGLPLPIHNKNQGNIAAAQAEFCRASQDVRRTELAIEARLAEVIREYESSAAAVEQYHQEILPRAEETLKLAEDGYKAGEFDFLQVLIARRTFFDANLEFVVAQVNLAKASVMLDGQVLSGGLDNTRDTDFDSGLRDQTLSGQ